MTMVAHGSYRGQFVVYVPDIIRYYLAGLHVSAIARKLRYNDRDYGQCSCPRESAVLYIVNRIFGPFHEPPHYAKEINNTEVASIDNRGLYRGLRA